MPNQRKPVILNGITYPSIKNFCETVEVKRDNESDSSFYNRCLIKHFPEKRKQRNLRSRRCILLKNQFNELRNMDIF